ncbi:MAG TPA: DUF748 domain-containing protein [Thermoanaerobaculia bacterium]|jgi:hypothetical protein|nr:DUF748 domain-containing protein [Thermoanaerobaculia bacterium]
MSAPSPEHREQPKEHPRRHDHRKHETFRGKVGHAAFHFSKHTLQLLGILLALVLLVIIASFFVDEPMRRAMEKDINQKLTGYTAHIQDLDFNIFGFSVILHNVTVSQDAYPTPPVALIPRLKASVQWSELLKLKLVSDFEFDQPQIYLNLPQLRKEASDPVPVHEKGWQEAAYAIYPLKINLFQVNDGSFTYLDKDPDRPLKVTHLFFRANNIRNIRSRERVYPSPVHAEGVVFGTGRAEFDGHANFLAQPHFGFNTLFTLDQVPLDYFRPILQRANMSIRDGFLSSHGRVEYAPTIKVAHVEDVVIDRVRFDYIHSAPRATESAMKVTRVVDKASNKPGLLVRLDQFHVKNSNLGIVNQVKNPPYRIFVSGANLDVTNLSNHFEQGPARATLTGRFVGSGAVSARASYRPEKAGPDLDLDVKIEGTQMTALNDVWRAYAKLDVVGGVMSVYSQIRIKNGYITGYVKPIFKDLNIYDPKQDAKKPFFKKLYEGVVEGLGDLLRNKKKDQVATVAQISGPVGNPNSSIWQILGKIIENAFVKAILPGFEQELNFLRKKR